MTALPARAVFLSYAHEDADAAHRICDALRAAGVEVWFDQSELRGGDAWDQKIRRQIKECALFLPIISTNTNARAEGYFRLEWHLAEQRSLLIAKGRPFIVPVSIDCVGDTDALVPDSFLTVQWTRLPGGETSAAFCERAKALLNPALETTRAPGVEHAEPAASPAYAKQGRRVPAMAWVVGLGVAAFAMVTLLWQRHPQSAPTSTASGTSRAPTVEKTAAAQTEAQQLVAKARQVLDDGDEMNHENYFLAEDLVKRAVTLDPAEPSAWALYARLSFSMIWHSVDLSGARREAMRRQAERARTLAPGSTEVQIAWADVRVTLRQDLPGVERDLRTLAAREPANWRVQRSLGIVYRALARYDEAIHALERARDLSGGAALASADLANALLRAHRHKEAETVLKEALAKGASGRLLTFDLLTRTQWRADLAGAKTALESWPDWLLLENRGAILAWRTWLWSGEHEKALAMAQRLPRDYLRDTFFTGPRAVLTARVHERAGHVEAARQDWRTTVQLADRELAVEPTDIAASYWKAWALARLGDTAGAQAICAQMQQRNQLVATNFAAYYFGGPGAGALWATVGRPDLAITALRAPPVKDLFAVTRAMLELDPAFDSLRADPRFPEVLATVPAPESEAEATPAPAKPDQKSVAVLAFRNLSDERDNDYFADGISEELANVLGRIPGLRVAASTSALSFKGRSVPARQIARDLNVTHLVEGSMQKAGNRVRITAKLINAADGFPVWTSDRFERELKDIFALQDEIAGLIAKHLSLKLGANPAASATMIAPEAYRLYLEARQAWGLRTMDGFARAEELLNRAIVLEPSFARAHAALADVWLVRGTAIAERAIGAFGQRESPTLVKIIATVQRALALDPDCAEAHASLGHARWNEWKFDDAARELRLAIALNPNYATAHQVLGRVLMTDGRMDEALAALRRAAELDPLSARIADNHGSSLFFAGRVEEALAFYERALSLQPESRQALGFKAIALVELRRDDAALVAASRLIESDDEFLMSSAYVFARTGRTRDTDNALARIPRNRFVVPKAAVLAALGRFDDCLAALAPETVPAQSVEKLYYWGAFDPLRRDPRFIRLLATLGMTEAHRRAQAWRAAHPPEKPK